MRSNLLTVGICCILLLSSCGEAEQSLADRGEYQSKIQFKQRAVDEIEKHQKAHYENQEQLKRLP